MRKFIKLLAVLAMLAILAGAVPAFAAEIPDWVKTLEGDTRPPVIEEKPDNTEELTAWREKKEKIKVPVLLYHHITNDEFTNEESVSLISPSDFRLHMTAIKVNFSPISLRRYYEYIMCDDGSVDIPDNPIIVTFDDGYTSNYEIAYPILKELEIPATIFVVTDTVGAAPGDGRVNNAHFTWEQAREMESSGLIEIQSHTVNHLKLTELDYNEMVRQLRKSRYDVEKNMNRECDMVAFPYGEYSDEVRSAARAAGYKMQLLVDDKSTEEIYDVNIPSDGPENVARMTIAGTMGNVNVIETIRKNLNKRTVE